METVDREVLETMPAHKLALLLASFAEHVAHHTATHTQRPHAFVSDAVTTIRAFVDGKYGRAYLEGRIVPTQRAIAEFERAVQKAEQEARLCLQAGNTDAYQSEVAGADKARRAVHATEAASFAVAFAASADYGAATQTDETLAFAISAIEAAQMAAYEPNLEAAYQRERLAAVLSAPAFVAA